MEARIQTIPTRTVNILTAVVVVVGMAWLFSTPLRASGDILGYAQDDFYYYLAVAQNLANGLGPTFDGITYTNGYHPLYLVILWVVCHLVSSLRGVFIFLAVLDTLSAMAVFFAARTFFARRLKSIWLTNGLTVAVLLLCLSKLYNQMEVTLTLPLGILFLLLLEQAPERLSPFRWAGIGLAAALLILSRLDAALLVGLCLLIAISIPQYRKALTGQKALAFMAGFLPLIAIYLIINEVYFHRLTPISGVAKQLKTGHGFSWHQLVIAAAETKVLFALSLLALVYLGRIWGRLEKEQRVVYLAALLFPFLHWGLILRLSDWQMWPWYSYSLRFAWLVTLALAGTAFASWFPAKKRVAGEVIVFAISLFLMVTRHYKVGAFMIDIARAARGISAFAQTHPGRYAMGDRAGMVGYLNSEPTMQTEGLMMDGAYLTHIQGQEPLRDVLKLYHVDYYVGFSERIGAQWRPVTGCFQAREPAQAGPASPVMRGVFCEQPAWELLQPSGETLIFDVRSREGP